MNVDLTRVYVDTGYCHSKSEFTYRNTRRERDGTEARNEKEIRITASSPSYS